jgi:hypothetical protein
MIDMNKYAMLALKMIAPHFRFIHSTMLNFNLMNIVQC